MGKKELMQLAKSLYFELDDEQLEQLEEEFISLKQNVERFKLVNTNDVKPTNFCLVKSCSNFREDLLDTANENKTDYLKNTKNIYKKYVVVKNEI